ncbi:MAG: outer membrane protein assembly factor BamD [Bacteroidales bacterium]
MFRKNFKILLGILIIGGVFTSCEYEKLLKSSNYKRKYDKALEYYHDEDYSKAIGLFEQINPSLKATNKADTVHFYLAKAYYETKDYILAKNYFQEFYRTFGDHSWAEDAQFLSAYCDYLLSPRPSLDQSNTREAINGFQMFIRRYPGSDKVQESRELIEDLQNKLAEKSYIAARLYYDMEDYKAAIIALNNSLKDYPESPYREEIRFLILKSKFLLASNSVKQKEEERFQSALDEYYTFIDQYPDSEYQKEVEKIYEVTQEKLNNKSGT